MEKGYLRLEILEDVAKRDIKKGEEITADYTEEGIPGFTMQCQCESDNCRVTIKTKFK